LRLAATVTFARGIGLFGAITCFTTVAALAAEPKPDAAVKNTTVAASVFLDNRIKADPALSAEGKYVAFVPWETLKPYLPPEGMKIFAGTRPKDDDDGTQ
jgi:hypothetical protein